MKHPPVFSKKAFDYCWACRYCVLSENIKIDIDDERFTSDFASSERWYSRHYCSKHESLLLTLRHECDEFERIPGNNK